MTVIPQRGATVSSVSIEEATDIYEMRVRLEPFAIELFVQRASDEQVVQLRAAVDKAAESVARGGSPREYLRAKDEYYEVLFAGCRSPALHATLLGLQGRARVLRAISLTQAGRPELAITELTEVMAAIEARDAARASASCRRHVGNVAATGLARLAELERPQQADAV